MIAEGFKDDGGLAVGLHPGVCVVLAAIGIQETKHGERDELVIGFEFPLEKWETGDGSRSGTRNKWLRENIKLGSAKRPTRLRSWLEQWREKAFTGDEALAFDLANLLGKPVGIEIVHNVNDRTGRTYEDIKTLCRVQNWVNAPEAAGSVREIPKATQELVIYDHQQHDETAWEKLPDWIRDLTPVGRRRKQLNSGAAGSGADVAASPQQDDKWADSNEEDLPF